MRGVGDCITEGTHILCYTRHSDIPEDGFATYGKIVCEHKPHKFEKNIARLVVGGYKIDYLFDLSTPPADITAFKLLINLVLSTPQAKFMTVDIRDFYLNTPMKQ